MNWSCNLNVLHNLETLLYLDKVYLIEEDQQFNQLGVIDNYSKWGNNLALILQGSGNYIQQVSGGYIYTDIATLELTKGSSQ